MDNERIRYTACPLCQSAAIRAIVKADLRGFPRWHEPLEPSMIWMKCEDCEDFLNTRNDNPYWAEIEHYHNFTRESLYSVLRQTGFRPIRYAVSERYRCCMEVLARAV